MSATTKNLKQISFRSQLKKVSDFNYSILAIIIFTFFIQEYFKKGVNKFLITPFNLNQVKQSTRLDILSILVVIWLIWSVRKIIRIKKQKLSFNSWVTIFLGLLFYILIIRFSGSFILESLLSIPKLKYLDILFLIFLFGITKFEYYGDQKEFTSIDGFIEDDFQENGIDLLGRDKYAKQVAIKILDTQPLNKAFVIAINSPWGFGKSGFLLMIERFLKIKDPSELKTVMEPLIRNYDETQKEQAYLNYNNTLVIRYNPWKNFDDKKTIQDFFEELSRYLKEYDSQLARNLKTYGNYLSKVDDSTFSKIIETSINIFDNNQTLTSIFDRINRSIERIRKKIIVFVDDIDRLTGDELIGIIKLIRNTANFKNVFFIVAYDHNYVLNTINKQNLISNKEEYLEKIVQLEITLPTFQNNSLMLCLNDKLKENESLKLSNVKIAAAINEISSILVLSKPLEGSTENAKIDVSDYFFRTENKDDSLIFKILKNIRDVVRFINSFKLSFESIGLVADPYEIILLEFLKIKYLSIYQIISKKGFLKFSGSEYQFIATSFDEFVTLSDFEKLNIRKSETDTIKTILTVIFNSSRKTFFRSVKYPRYFDMYFSYQAPALTALEKIEPALETKNIEDLMQVVDESKDDKSLDDLKNFLNSQFEFTNKDDFEIILKALFYIAKYDKEEKSETIYQIRNILQDRDILKSFYDEKPEGLSKTLLSILQDERYSLNTRMEVAADELYKNVNRRSTDENTVLDENIILLIDDKSSLQKIVFDCFKQKIDAKNAFDETINNLYLKNLKEIKDVTRKIVITEEANELMRNFIVSHPNEYLKKYLLREHPEPPPFLQEGVGRYYHLDPFLLHYFNDWETVLDFFKSEAVIELFQNDDEKMFYGILLDAVDRSKENNLDKFLIRDKNTINLISKFIAVKYFK